MFSICPDISRRGTGMLWCGLATLRLGRTTWDIGIHQDSVGPCWQCATNSDERKFISYLNYGYCVYIDVFFFAYVMG